MCVCGESELGCIGGKVEKEQCCISLYFCTIIIFIFSFCFKLILVADH